MCTAQDTFGRHSQIVLIYLNKIVFDIIGSRPKVQIMLQLPIMLKRTLQHLVLELHVHKAFFNVLLVPNQKIITVEGKGLLAAMYTSVIKRLSENKGGAEMEKALKCIEDPSKPDRDQIVLISKSFLSSSSCYASDGFKFIIYHLHRLKQLLVLIK